MLCVECCSDVPSLTDNEHGALVLRRCDACGKSADRFLEADEVQVGLGIVLLRRAAWLHVVFNDASTGAAMKMLSSATVATVLDALVAVVWMQQLDAPDSRFRTVHAHAVPLTFASAASSTATLRYSGAADVVQTAFRTRPLTCAGTVLAAVGEAAVGGLALMWASSLVARRYVTLAQGMRAAAVAASVKLGLLLFVVWDLPVSSLPLLGIGALLFHFAAAECLSGAGKFASAVIVLVVVGGAVLLRAPPQRAPVHIFA
jgi:hypothetical protein